MQPDNLITAVFSFHDRTASIVILALFGTAFAVAFLLLGIGAWRETHRSPRAYSRPTYRPMANTVARGSRRYR